MSTQASGSSNKRQKSTENPSQPPNGNFRQGSSPFGQQQFQQPPYGGGPPPGGQQFPIQQPGYMWQPGQQQPPPYGNQMAPVHWQGGQQGPPGMYRQSPPNVGPNAPSMGLDPSGNNWSGYRGSPPGQPNSGPPQGRRSGKGSQKSGSKSNADGAGTPSNVPNSSYQPWGQPQQQWNQNQWGGGPPPPQMWQQGQPGPPIPPPQPSPPPGPQHMQGQPMVPMNQNPWPGGRRSSTPPRQSKGRPRSSPDPLMGPGGFPLGGLPPDVLCAPIGLDARADQDVFMTSTGVGPGPEEETRPKTSGGSSVASREKGRGSYRCGRCGVPKKGHVCPYQPKLKRRPDEPPPETRNAAVQVEMDEFLTLRRLNIEIQGFPESYATASHFLADSRVVGEPHPYALGDSGVLTHGPYMGIDQVHGSVPQQVASQPMKAEAEASRESPRTTVENKTDVVEVPAEKEKTTA